MKKKPLPRIAPLPIPNQIKKPKPPKPPKKHKKHGWVCFWCGTKEGQATKDHLISRPLWKTLDDETRYKFYRQWHLVKCCAPCNQLRSMISSLFAQSRVFVKQAERKLEIDARKLKRFMMNRSDLHIEIELMKARINEKIEGDLRHILLLEITGLMEV